MRSHCGVNFSRCVNFAIPTGAQNTRKDAPREPNPSTGAVCNDLNRVVVACYPGSQIYFVQSSGITCQPCYTLRRVTRPFTRTDLRPRAPRRRGAEGAPPVSRPKAGKESKGAKTAKKQDARFGLDGIWGDARALEGLGFRV